ncbi:GntR family transcriptional regulator [Jiangella asiatica]|uniref:GntR family transcriptional regulator n=2 Tax=Jiangella asiatica TaxID=2530372 RepID=A0A4R5D585_9ACTN|nr:GntR family transcriptional regulator [Jiangella asiatica]
MGASNLMSRESFLEILARFELSGSPCILIAMSQDRKNERAYLALKADIVEGRLRPGQLIVEGELAERYALSKTPVRHALNRLEVEGMVEILPRRGSIVRFFSVRDVQHVYLLRRLLEPEASALAAKRATPEDVERLRELEARAEAARIDGDFSPGAAFHVAVAELARVPPLTAIIEGLQTKVQWFLRVQQLNGEPIPLQHPHKPLIDAIAAGDADQARMITESALTRSITVILESMAELSVPSHTA